MDGNIKHKMSHSIKRVSFEFPYDSFAELLDGLKKDECNLVMSRNAALLVAIQSAKSTSFICTSILSNYLPSLIIVCLSYFFHSWWFLINLALIHIPKPMWVSICGIFYGVASKNDFILISSILIFTSGLLHSLHEIHYRVIAINLLKNDSDLFFDAWERGLVSIKKKDGQIFQYKSSWKSSVLQKEENDS